MHQLLDSVVYETAPLPVRKRFAMMTANAAAAAEGASALQAQALRVAIGVVLRDEDVLLVCRRDDGTSGISWQFPAGVIKPGVRAETATIGETLDETGCIAPSA